MLQRFETSQWVPYPVELVFAFFANPMNLPALMPQGLESRIEDARVQPPPPRPIAVDPTRRYRSVAAGTGSEILVSFYPIRWVRKRVSWLARITEFEWNSHFCDEQVHGPFTRFHHCHGIATEAREGVAGTRVSDTVEFELPFGWFGTLGVGFVKRNFRQMFEYRQKRLPEILEAASRQAVRQA